MTIVDFKDFFAGKSPIHLRRLPSIGEEFKKFSSELARIVPGPRKKENWSVRWYTKISRNSQVSSLGLCLSLEKGELDCEMVFHDENQIKKGRNDEYNAQNYDETHDSLNFSLRDD